MSLPYAKILGRIGRGLVGEALLLGEKPAKGVSRVHEFRFEVSGRGKGI